MEVNGKMHGFEVIVPGKANMEHTIIPSTEAKSRKDGGTRSIAPTHYGRIFSVGGHHDQAEFAVRYREPKDEGGPFQAGFQAREMPLHPDTDVNKKSKIRHLEAFQIHNLSNNNWSHYKKSFVLIYSNLGMWINVSCKVIDKKAAKEKPDVAKDEADARCTTERVSVELVNA
ncbi:hypothetical protein Tco_1011636 [Tanacetum coccineum]